MFCVHAVVRIELQIITSSAHVGKRVLPSSERRGGCAIKKMLRSHRSGADGVVSSAEHFVCATTRSARAMVASQLFLAAQPPLLSKEGNTLAPETRLRQIVYRIQALRLQVFEKAPRFFVVELRIGRFDTKEKAVLRHQVEPRFVEQRVVRFRQTVYCQHAE